MKSNRGFNKLTSRRNRTRSHHRLREVYRCAEATIPAEISAVGITKLFRVSQAIQAQPERARKSRFADWREHPAKQKEPRRRSLYSFTVSVCGRLYQQLQAECGQHLQYCAERWIHVAAERSV